MFASLIPGAPTAHRRVDPRAPRAPQAHPDAGAEGINLGGLHMDGRVGDSVSRQTQLKTARTTAGSTCQGVVRDSGAASSNGDARQPTPQVLAGEG